jgi:hypothetical protein
MMAVKRCIATATKNADFTIRPKRSQWFEQARHHDGVTNFVVVRQDEDAMSHA